jgi:hypothetical protein
MPTQKVLVGLAWLAVGCGGSTVSIPGDDAGAGRPTAPVYPTTTTSSTPVVPVRPQPTRDAGLRDGAVVPVDGGGVDPGFVACNGVQCESTTSYCCVEPPPGTIRCVAQTTSSCGGLRRQCDEAADCPTGEQCYIPPNAALFVAYNTTCGAFTPDPYSYQVCKSSAECVNGQTCVAQNCRGQVIRTCGQIPAQRCQ